MLFFLFNLFFKDINSKNSIVFHFIFYFLISLMFSIILSLLCALTSKWERKAVDKASKDLSQTINFFHRVALTIKENVLTEPGLYSVFQ